MHRFFVEASQVKDGKIRITGNDVNHIKNVLRMSPDDVFCAVCKEEPYEYHCRILHIDKDSVETQIESRAETQRELPCEIVLFQGLPKSDKMELIIQKAVELGVHRIVPVATERTIVKLDAKKEAAKLKRWMSISESAAKQSKRMLIPEVTKVVSYQQALKMAEQMNVNMIPYELAEGMEETRRVIGSIQPGQSVGIFIGPEGGFEPEEIEDAMKIGVRPVTLGRRILRTETAGLATLAMLVYNLER